MQIPTVHQFMNEIDKLPYLGEPKEEAEKMFARNNISSIEWVLPGKCVTLEAKYHPVVFLNEKNRVVEIWG